MNSLSSLHSFNPIKIDQAFERFSYASTEKKVAAVALAVFAALAVIGGAAAMVAGTGLLAGSLVVIIGVGIGAGALAAYIASVVFQFATLDKRVQFRMNVVNHGMQISIPEDFVRDYLNSPESITTDTFIRGISSQYVTHEALVNQIKNIDLKRIQDIRNKDGKSVMIIFGRKKVVEDIFDTLNPDVQTTFLQDTLSLFSFCGRDNYGFPANMGPGRLIREIVVENGVRYFYLTAIPLQRQLEGDFDEPQVLEVASAYTLRMNLDKRDASVQLFQLDGVKLVDEQFGVIA